MQGIALTKDYGIKSDNVMWNFSKQIPPPDTGGTLTGMTLNGKPFLGEFTL
ncbi:MAG: hypothetical protein HQL04_04240 [Nitrospirae bacterium]|nr:hypothetical protein [Nitrospirota bacterium]